MEVHGNTGQKALMQRRGASGPAARLQYATLFLQSNGLKRSVKLPRTWQKTTEFTACLPCPGYFTPQSRMTLPDLPLPMTSKPLRKSSMGKRWVMTWLMSSPLSIMAAILYQVSNISRP